MKDVCRHGLVWCRECHGDKSGKETMKAPSVNKTSVVSEQSGGRFVSTGKCRLCYKERARGSHSYCRAHETERVRRWRKSRQNGVAIDKRTGSD